MRPRTSTSSRPRAPSGAPEDASLAALAGLVALAVELLVVVALSRTEFASGWEVAVGALSLAPTAFLASLVPTLAGAAVFGLLRRGSQVERVVLCALSALFAAPVAVLVSTGRHFASVPLRAAFVAGVTALAAGATYAAAPRIAAFCRSRPRHFAATALGGLVLLEAANLLVLPRLYPAFHSALAALSLACVPLALLSFRAARTVRDGAPGRTLQWPLAAALLLAVSVALVPASAAAFARFDNVRFLLHERAPILSQAVALAARLSPPPPLDTAAVCLDGAGCGPASETHEGPSFAGRDIVLVTVDALRADHVGAYGYGRPTTPNIDRLAAEGAVFEHAYCPTPHTSYSLTSLMTGKYMRPLLLQGAGADSDTLPTYLKRYGYRTAAFYPPAVFFIDQPLFQSFERTGFDFEYRKVEFMEGQGRVEQIEGYLDALPSAQRLLLWVHLFGPHEPYEAHPEHAFGDRDVDRYDSEIAAADHVVGRVTARIRKLRPGAVVIVAADHGEEFGDHGGRYHGTTVYEEQVRVPLVVSAPGAVAPRRIREVVQTIDIVPTLLGALAIPRGPRLRGRDLGPLLAGSRPEGQGIAFVETEENTLLAEGAHRLVCARKLGACRLFDVARDPAERTDLATADPERFERMRTSLRALGGSHGRFELEGLRAETGHGWPAPILRGLAGDADAAPDLAALLDDVDRGIRRKAAELLFELRRVETAPALRLALSRDEDVQVRRWCALALTRLGQTAPLVNELLAGDDPGFQRLAALALAESGDARGQGLLVDWWQKGAKDDHARALDLLAAFTRLKTKDAVWPLVQSLPNVRLRPRIAGALGAIGDDAARGPLAAALMGERYQTARIAIAEAIVALGGKEELARPLVRFLGVPDPLPNGVRYGLRAGILESMGGPTKKGLATLARQSDVGVKLPIVVPKGGNGTGMRVIVLARAEGRPGEIRIGRPLHDLQYDMKGMPVNLRKAPEIHDREFVSLAIPAGPDPVEIKGMLPASLGARTGRALDLVVFAERHVHVEGLVVVPLSDELPPPPPEPWSPERAGEGMSAGAGPAGR